jgi:hypothetical protein
MAAIAGVVPESQISASTMAIAIEWTNWELSQTLLQYQMLGLTDDPELKKVLKFIDKFTGKGRVTPRAVRNWWSGSEKPATHEIRSFMAKVVGLGYAIDNGESIDSSKYQIQILENPSPFSPSMSETSTQQHSQRGLSVSPSFQNETSDVSNSNSSSDGLSLSPQVSPSSDQTEVAKQENVDPDDFTKNGLSLSPSLEPSSDGDYISSVDKNGLSLSPSLMIYTATVLDIDGLNGLGISEKNNLKTETINDGEEDELN